MGPAGSAAGPFLDFHLEKKGNRNTNTEILRPENDDERMSERESEGEWQQNNGETLLAIFS